MQTHPYSKNQTPSGVAGQVCPGSLTLPAVLSAVAYPAVRASEDARAKRRPTRLHEASEGWGLGANQAGTTYLAPASTVQERARLDDMSNVSEPALKLGYAYQPKVRFVAVLGVVAPLSNGSTQTQEPLRGKQDSNPSLSLYAKPGKPDYLWGNSGGKPQGDLIGKRVKERGVSEWAPVMGVIGDRLGWNPVILPRRETVLTSTWSVITRELGEPSERRVSK